MDYTLWGGIATLTLATILELSLIGFYAKMEWNEKRSFAFVVLLISALIVITIYLTFLHLALLIVVEV